MYSSQHEFVKVRYSKYCLTKSVIYIVMVHVGELYSLKIVISNLKHINMDLIWIAVIAFISATIQLWIYAFI